MANTKNNKEQTITLNDKKYNISDMNSDQKNYLAHVSDLNRKVETTKFNLQQLEMGLKHFVSLLSDSLNKKE
tara:strand:- start:2249 stop:2464 length:216 start_codon:yes stop_codon:yes gene_type:complete